MLTPSSIGVIGAGTMGNGIAQACATVGIAVVMLDIHQTAVERGLATIAGSLDRLVKKDKLTVTDRDAALARVAAARPTTTSSPATSSSRRRPRTWT